MSISADSLQASALGTTPLPMARAQGWRATMSNALIITRREVRDSFRDWRIIAPIVILTFAFPFLAQFIAGRFTEFVTDFGAQIIGERTIPFLLMIVGFFPISISLVIALETFVGEKERRSLEPLLSTPLTNTELYIGKTLAAMIPPLVSSYGGMAVYLATLVLGDLAWRPQFMLVVQIILLTTVHALVMVTGAVVVSSQTTSTRAANLLASFIIIPMTLLIQGESVIMFLAPDADSANGIGALWAIFAGLIVTVVLLLRVGGSIFNREELLGRSLDGINLRATFTKFWRHIRAVDASGTPAPNLFAWYTRGMALSLRRVGAAFWITIGMFVTVFIAGVIIGALPGFQLGLPRDLPLNEVGDNIGAYSGLIFGQGNPVIAIAWNNGRILLAAALLSMFSFGIAALILTPLVYGVLGFTLMQVIGAGYDPSFFIPAILTHGIIEIPVIVIATATALKFGASITKPPAGQTVGHAWSLAFADTIKIGVGIVVPGLIIAAALEAYVTPIMVRLVLGG